MISSGQVDMVDEYLHLCNGGVLLPVHLTDAEVEYYSVLAKTQGMTLAGYISSLMPRAIELLKRELNK